MSPSSFANIVARQINAIRCATVKRVSKQVASALLMALAWGCYGQQIPAGMAMHRLQAGSLDQDGWTEGNSTEGQFSARMPCLFNDFTSADRSEDSKTAKTYTLGCLRADRKKFSVTRVRYRNPEVDSQYFFRRAETGVSWPDAKVVKLSYKGSPAVEVTIADATKCGFVRLVHATPDNLLMITEAPKESCEGLAAMSRKFFESLHIGQR